MVGAHELRQRPATSFSRGGYACSDEWLVEGWVRSHYLLAPATT